jgi:hypothetical protein
MGESRQRGGTERVGYALTTLTKLCGLVLAMNSGLFHTQDPNFAVQIAFEGFMMAGAQGAESLIDRFLGGGK